MIFVKNIARFWVSQHAAQDHLARVVAQQFAHVCKHEHDDMLPCRLNLARQNASLCLH